MLAGIGLKSLAIQSFGPDQVIAQDAGGPLVELYSTAAIDAVAPRDNGIRAIFLDAPSNLALAYLANSRGILDSC